MRLIEHNGIAYNILRWRNLENSGGTPAERFCAFKALQVFYTEN